MIQLLLVEHTCEKLNFKELGDMNGDFLAEKYDLSCCSFVGEVIKEYLVAGVGGENTSVGGSDLSVFDPTCLHRWTCMISAAS